ncbi:PREDICTED: uncharacterized protein LOC109173552 [Ipomoea nil]|uniref:uncharacterized protein LOC109173552 n=1 Tax=Ipomoea nil TaxID=35883 RepID=UPI0009009F8C|nr:PREDICTED: uncharacterized protein LOC109173552 [Ipomoea nil]
MSARGGEIGTGTRRPSDHKRRTSSTSVLQKQNSSKSRATTDGNSSKPTKCATYTCSFKRSSQLSSSSAIRYLKLLGGKMVAALRMMSPKRSRKVTSSETTPKPPALDSHRAEAIHDCIQFINDSSSLPRSNSVSCQGHPYARRLSGNEVELVENLSAMHVKPRDILTSVKMQNPDNVSITKTIYNARQKFRMMDNADELEDLFFVHPKSMEKWRAFPHVLLIDATYKTNRYSMPLVEMVGVTSTNMTFCIAFAFMHKENESNYTWALNCLKATIEGCITPRVIVTDRELALMKACVFGYIDDNWLQPYKEMFVSVWTDRYLNFGNHTTNRVESQHAKLKKYLESSQSDLETSLVYIDRVIQSQDTSIKASLEQSKILIRHRFNTSHFQELRGFVSIHALNLIFNEFERSRAGGITFENCGCRLRTSCGLPCAHEQVTYFNCGKPIPLDSIDIFWRKLDLSSSISLTNEDFGVEHELHMFKDQFKKQSRTGKFNILRKLRELIAPSTTSIREPPVQINVRGRPTSKNKSLIRTLSLRKTKAEPNNIQFQEQARNSCSAAPTSGDRHFYHPYMLQLPVIFHPFIMQVQDVKSDGNCGFRAVALCLGFKEDEWFKIRSNLIEELESHTMEYTDMFGTQGWYNAYNMLNFFAQDRCAPVEHWMTMPEMGVLIASGYNVILYVLSMAGSTTYLPLRSSPPPWYEHVAITLGYVNNNHYVKVTLTGGYPMPTIAPQWAYFRYDCANAWMTPYMNRIESYNEHVRSNCTREMLY